MTTTMLERSDMALQDAVHESVAGVSARADGVEATDTGMRVVTAKQWGAGKEGASWPQLPRRLFYTTWRLLPGWAQAMAFRLGAPKVSMGAVAVIVDLRGRILLAHHPYRRRPWGLPGGLVGRREQPVEAVARELREELGVAAAVGPLLYAETCLPGRHLTLYYLATIDGLPREDGVEIDAFRSATPDEALALLGEEAAPWLACLQSMTHPQMRAS